MTEDIQFLIDFQEELKTQPNDGNADPVYWVVGDYKWEPCWEGEAEDFEIYLHDDATAYNWKEFMKEELDDTYELSKEQMIELKNISSADDLLDWVQEFIDEEAYLVPVKQNHVIHNSTMFLTKQEAQEHIRLNHYHYTNKAHTYAMTAWRAPKVERLLNILKNFDWNAIEASTTKQPEEMAKNGLGI